MEQPEQENRVEALGHAVRHKGKAETADDIVRNAEKYLAFLKGETADSSE